MTDGCVYYQVKALHGWTVGYCTREGPAFDPERDCTIRTCPIFKPSWFTTMFSPGMKIKDFKKKALHQAAEYAGSLREAAQK